MSFAQCEVDEIRLLAVGDLLADYTPCRNDSSGRKNGGSGKRRFPNRKGPDNYPCHAIQSPQYVVLADSDTHPYCLGCRV